MFGAFFVLLRGKTGRSSLLKDWFLVVNGWVRVLVWWKRLSLFLFACLDVQCLIFSYPVSSSSDHDYHKSQITISRNDFYLLYRKRSVK